MLPIDTFLLSGKDADPDIPIYKQAKAEYAKLWKWRVMSKPGGILDALAQTMPAAVILNEVEPGSNMRRLVPGNCPDSGLKKLGRTG